MKNIKNYDIQRIISKDVIKDTTLCKMSIQVKMFKNVYILNGIVDKDGNEVFEFTTDHVDVNVINSNYIKVNTTSKHDENEPYDSNSYLYQVIDNGLRIACCSKEQDLVVIDDYVLGNSFIEHRIENKKGTKYIYDLKSRKDIYVYNGYLKDNLKNNKIILHEYFNDGEADVFLDLDNVKDAKEYEEITRSSINNRKLLEVVLISREDVYENKQMIYALLNLDGEYVVKPYDTYTCSEVEEGKTLNKIKRDFIHRIEQDKKYKILSLSKKRTGV